MSEPLEVVMLGGPEDGRIWALPAGRTVEFYTSVADPFAVPAETIQRPILAVGLPDGRVLRFVVGDTTSTSWDAQAKVGQFIADAVREKLDRKGGAA